MNGFQYALYGIHRNFDYIDGCLETIERRVLIATFSSHQKAKAYVDARKAPESSRLQFFRDNTEMSAFTSYEIDSSIPHNPE